MLRFGGLGSVRRPLPSAEPKDTAGSEPAATSPGTPPDLGSSGPGPLELPPRPDANPSLAQGIAKFTSQLFQAPGPTSVGSLPGPQRFLLQGALPAALKRAAAPHPHPGLPNPFDAVALLQASKTQRRALAYYLEPDFPRRPLNLKRLILGEVEPLLMAKERDQVLGFHLPRPFSLDSRQEPLTYSMEAEQSLRGRMELLHYYAPDPTGALDPRCLPDELLQRLRPAGNPQAWARMSPDQQRSALRWKILPDAAKWTYLLEYQKLGPQVTLHRIPEAKDTGTGGTAPDSLSSTVKWEGYTPLGCAEIMSSSKYVSLDQLFLDLAFVAGISETAPGFHTHQVVELSTPEDVKRLGPKVVGLAALQDLELFANSVATGGNLLTHTHLEVWQASGINEVASSLETGKIDLDVIGVHKFHAVGVRAGLYGDPRRLGTEVRAVRMGDNQTLVKVNHRLAKLLSEGLFAQLPSPPWEAWNAGDPALPGQAEAAARQDPRLAHLLPGAELDFQNILELAAGEHSARDAFKFASPFWNFEGLPGFGEVDRARIEEARHHFSGALLKISTTLSEALAADRTLDTDSVREAVTRAVRRFFAEAQVGETVDGVLSRLAEGAPL